jgi:hypothetical protein
VCGSPGSCETANSGRKSRMDQTGIRVSWFEDPV